MTVYHNNTDSYYSPCSSLASTTTTRIPPHVLPPLSESPPPVPATSVTATTTVWLSDDDIRCCLVQLRLPQNTVQCEDGVYMLYTQQEGLVVVRDISSWVAPFRPSQGAPLLRPFCLFTPPRLDGKYGRRFIPTAAYTTQTTDLVGSGSSGDRQCQKTTQNAHINNMSAASPSLPCSSSPSPSTPLSPSSNQQTFALPDTISRSSPSSSPSLVPSSPSSLYKRPLCPSSSAATSSYRCASFRPSTVVSKITLCAFYTEELALLQLQLKYIQAQTHTPSGVVMSTTIETTFHSKNNTITTTTADDIISSEDPTSSIIGGDKPDRKQMKAADLMDDNKAECGIVSSCSSHRIAAIHKEDVYANFVFPPPAASYTECPSADMVSSSAVCRLLLEFNSESAKPTTTTGKSEILQLRPQGLTKVAEEPSALRAPLRKFKQMYKEAFSESATTEGLKLANPESQNSLSVAATNAPPVIACRSTLNSVDGRASGKACPRYVVDAEGRRVLRRGYELSGDYLKHQQQGKIFELQGVFGTNVKNKIQPTPPPRGLAATGMITSENNKNDKKTQRQNRSPTGSPLSPSSTAPSSSRGREVSSTSDQCSTAGGDSSVLDTTGVSKESVAKEGDMKMKDKENGGTTNGARDAVGDVEESQGAFIPGDLFGKKGSAKKWAYVADDVDEDGIDEVLNLPSVLAEECKLLAGRRSTPLTGRCNLSLANLRTLAALTKTFSISMYHYEGTRPIFFSPVLTLRETKDVQSVPIDKSSSRVVYSGDRKEDSTKDSSGSSEGERRGRADSQTSFSEKHKQETMGPSSPGGEQQTALNSDNITVESRGGGRADGCLSVGTVKVNENIYRVPYGEMSYFGHVIEDGDILRVTYPSEHRGIYEEDIFRLWGEDTLKTAIQKIAEISPHGANADFSAIHLAQYCHTLFWNLARLYEGDVDLGVRVLFPSLPERSRRLKRPIRDEVIPEEEPISEKRQKYVDRKSYFDRVKEHFKKLSQICANTSKHKRSLRVKLNVNRCNEDRVRQKNLDDEATLMKSVIDETGSIFIRKLAGLTPLQKRLVYDYCLNIDFSAPVELTSVEHKGRAVVAADDIERDDFVLEYKGETLSDKDARSQDLKYNRSHNHRNGSFMFYFKYDSRNFAIDAMNEFKPYGVARLINHSRLNPNLIPKPTSIDGRARLFFVAKCPITKGTELLVDYGERDRQVIENNPWLMY
eukprot:GHVS01001464.1.p1 GENE.GHVS01001464.1~~GHVS01001464.1.p1  ORF type:complete len:1211 (+),score=241.26 GHVS01001464.1:445-4077(+)